MKSRRGQSTLELSLVVGMLFLLLIGIVRIMGWFNTDLSRRQDSYLYTRVEAGSVRPGMGNPHITTELSVLAEEDSPPYSVQELIDLVFTTAKDAQEALAALEDLRSQVVGTSGSARGKAARARTYTRQYLAALDEAIREISEDPDYFNALQGTEGFESMTSKSRGDGWWVNH